MDAIEAHRMSGAVPEGSDRSLTSGRAPQTLPLNSRRLTATLLRQLAGGLGVPTTAARGDLLTMIEATLTDEGRNPLHIQVVLQEVEGGTYIRLRDESGIFKEVEPLEDEELSLHGESGEESESSETVTALREEVKQLKEELVKQKAKTTDLWKLNCEQMATLDNSLCAKEDEIAKLKEEISRLGRSSPSITSEVPSMESEGTMESDGSSEAGSGHRTISRVRRGKAPPVETFTGEDPEGRLDDWLPTLERTADWNGWTDEDTLIQLAGHLKGRALQEWSLLPDCEKTNYSEAIGALRSRLDPGSRLMAAQDFRHASQEEHERVSDFIRRLEQLFKLAYGRDALSMETRYILLYGQLQEGLKLKIIESPAVSGAVDYSSLCLAAKAEEKRLAELKKRRQYHTDRTTKPNNTNKSEDTSRNLKQSS